MALVQSRSGVELSTLVANIERDQKFLASLQSYVKGEEQRAQNLDMQLEFPAESVQCSNNLVELRKRVKKQWKKLSLVDLPLLKGRLQKDLEDLEIGIGALDGRIKILPDIFATKQKVLAILQSEQMEGTDLPSLRDRVHACIESHPHMPLKLLQELCLIEGRINIASKSSDPVPGGNKADLSPLLTRMPTSQPYPTVRLAPLLPRNIIEERFKTAESEFVNRWNALCSQMAFVPFREGRSDEELRGEFQTFVENVRYELYFQDPSLPIKESRVGYEICEALLFDDLVRHKSAIAFAYNAVSPHFNASMICAKGRYFIACEGARGKDVPRFFHMLSSHQVTHLLRLTPSHDGSEEKCYPYWDGLQSSMEGGCQLNIPMNAETSYPIKYYQEDEWGDHQGYPPGKLLEFATKVRADISKRGTLLAAHCSAGIGRTMTFIAAIMILDTLEKSEPLSIQEICLRLSLQRMNSVGNADQYIVLHRLVEAYQSQARSLTSQ